MACNCGTNLAPNLPCVCATVKVRARITALTRKLNQAIDSDSTWNEIERIQNTLKFWRGIA